MDLKLGVWDGFVLPPLGLPTGEPVPRRLEAVYHDTADLRLLRRGVMARVSGSEWTVRWPGRSVIGADAVALTRGWALGASLAPVARLVTSRVTLPLDGAALHQDDVAVLRGERVAARFAELVIEGASEPLLEALRGQLTEAGAQPIDPAPKLVRALGPAAVVPWPLEVSPPGADASAAEVIRFRLMQAVAVLADQHAPVLLDGVVRQARGAVRALRRDLRLFGPLLDAAAPPDAGAVASALRRVRRLDTVIERCAGRRGTEDALDLLRAEREAALESARDVLRDESYGALLASLAEFASAPPLVRAARRPAGEALPKLLRKPLTQLRRAEGRDSEAPHAPALRLSVALDAALPYCGRDARRSLAGLDELLDTLREHHRASYSVRVLRELAREAPDAAWSAGLLAGLETARAGEARARVAAVWADAVRRKRWAWVP